MVVSLVVLTMLLSAASLLALACSLSQVEESVSFWRKKKIGTKRIVIKERMEKKKKRKNEMRASCWAWSNDGF